MGSETLPSACYLDRLG